MWASRRPHAYELAGVLSMGGGLRFSHFYFLGNERDLDRLDGTHVAIELAVGLLSLRGDGLAAPCLDEGDLKKRTGFCH